MKNHVNFSHITDKIVYFTTYKNLIRPMTQYLLKVKIKILEKYTYKRTFVLSPIDFQELFLKELSGVKNVEFRPTRDESILSSKASYKRIRKATSTSTGSTPVSDCFS